MSRVVPTDVRNFIEPGDMETGNDKIKSYEKLTYGELVDEYQNNENDRPWLSELLLKKLYHSRFNSLDIFKQLQLTPQDSPAYRDVLGRAICVAFTQLMLYVYLSLGVVDGRVSNYGLAMGVSTIPFAFFLGYRGVITELSDENWIPFNLSGGIWRYVDITLNQVCIFLRAIIIPCILLKSPTPLDCVLNITAATFITELDNEISFHADKQFIEHAIENGSKIKTSNWNDFSLSDLIPYFKRKFKSLVFIVCFCDIICIFMLYNWEFYGNFHPF